ncbi:MAG: HPr family phosphocarrier protein [Candidatus Nanopelagicaceae bacterium]
MFTRSMEVKAAVGLHARPAAQFAEIAKTAGFPVKVGRNESQLVNAASPLRLLTLKVAQGESILVVCETSDEANAKKILDNLEACIQN